ncbi:MAG: hypothetical protein Q4G33_12260 [bacterium]|nr:hypothetical protein [bacterium]
MAEVYGVKPKKFTKEWWPYFWMYYKWHTIGIVFVVLAVVFTVAQCLMRPKTDLSITYAGHHMFTDEQAAQISADMGGVIDDIDGDGHKNVDFQRYTFMDKPGTEESDYAMQTKLNMEFYNDRSYIFLPDEQLLKTMTNNDYCDDLYAPVTAWAQNMPDESLLYSIEGVPYAVKLTDSAYLNSLGYDTEMYIMLKRDSKDDELEKAAYEQSVKIANKLISK